MQGQDDSLFFRKGCEQIRKGLRIARAAHRNRGYSLDSSRFIKILKESKEWGGLCKRSREACERYAHADVEKRRNKEEGRLRRFDSF